MNYTLESVHYFRKGLSTIVETVLEAKTKKPIWNFRNNMASIFDKIEKRAVIIQEAKYLVSEKPTEIDVIITEMINWYTSKKGGSYDGALVVPVCNRITRIIISILGETTLLDEELKEWSEKENV